MFLNVIIYYFKLNYRRVRFLGTCLFVPVCQINYEIEKGEFELFFFFLFTKNFKIVNTKSLLKSKFKCMKILDLFFKSVVSKPTWMSVKWQDTSFHRKFKDKNERLTIHYWQNLEILYILYKIWKKVLAKLL